MYREEEERNICKHRDIDINEITRQCALDEPNNKKWKLRVDNRVWIKKRVALASFATEVILARLQVVVQWNVGS